MYVIVAELRIDHRHRDEFVSFMAQYTATTRRETGNLAFRLTADLDDPSAFTMVEQWADDDAIRFHFAQDYVRDFLARTPSFGFEVTGSVFTVSEHGPLLETLREIIDAGAAP